MNVPEVLGQKQNCNITAVKTKLNRDEVGFLNIDETVHPRVYVGATSDFETSCSDPKNGSK